MKKAHALYLHARMPHLAPLPVPELEAIMAATAGVDLSAVTQFRRVYGDERYERELPDMIANEEFWNAARAVGVR